MMVPKKNDKTNGRDGRAHVVCPIRHARGRGFVWFVCLWFFGVFVVGCGSGNDHVDQLHSGSTDQRAQAAAFLGAQRIGEAIPHLRTALRDTVPEVQAKVIWALGMLRSKDALPDLLPFLHHANRNIRQATVQALMQIEEPGVIGAIETARKVEQDTWVQTDMDRAIDHLRQFEGETKVNEGQVRGEFF